MGLYRKIERFLFPCTRRLDIEISRHHKACKKAQRAVVVYGPKVIDCVFNSHVGKQV